MNKLKRNKILDGFAANLPPRYHEQMYTLKDILEDTMIDYRKYENENYVITSTEAENIISALKSMPGFSMENFMVIPNVVAVGSELSDIKVFVKVLWIAYYMLSITNPELFEDESDERIMKCDKCGALDKKSRFVTFRAENNHSWRINLCMECSTWLRRMLEDKEEEE